MPNCMILVLLAARRTRRSRRGACRGQGTTGSRDSVLRGWSAPAPTATGCRGGAAGPGPPAPTAAPASPSQPPPPSTTMTTPSTRPSLPCRAAAPRSAGSSSHQIHQADLKIKSKENKVRDRSRGSLSHERNKENAEEKSFVEREV